MLNFLRCDVPETIFTLHLDPGVRQLLSDPDPERIGISRQVRILSAFMGIYPGFNAWRKLESAG